MAAGRGRARTVETDRRPPSAEPPDEGERGAHAWEFDEAESWEPVVPDTWELPADRQTPAEAPTSAGWSDAARSEEEWVDAAHHEGAAGPELGIEAEPAATVTDDSARVPYLESVAAQYLGDEPVPTRARRTARPTASTTPERPAGTNAARMALGLATMAAQRVRGGVPAGDGFVTGVGLVQEATNGLREIGRRLLGPATRATTGAVKSAAMLPVVGVPVRAALRARNKLGRAVSDARARGHHTVEAGRADAERALRDGVDRTLRWASDKALAPLAEQLAPRVAEHMLPRVIAEVSGGPSHGWERDSPGRRRR